MHSSTVTRFGSLFFLSFFFFFAGCKNDMKTVNNMTLSNQKAFMTARDIEVFFSDSGRVQAKLTSPLVLRYSGNDAFTEFPKGFKVIIYDSAMRVESSITGEYGKRWENKRIMYARKNVVVRNEIKEQQLNTEELTWDENKNMIFSNVRVKVTTRDKVLYGEGLEANESFTRYRFLKVTGQMTVKQDSI